MGPLLKNARQTMAAERKETALQRYSRRGGFPLQVPERFLGNMDWGFENFEVGENRRSPIQPEQTRMWLGGCSY